MKIRTKTILTFVFLTLFVSAFAQPSITINPLFFDEVIYQNQYLTKNINILNTGTDSCNWNAEISMITPGNEDCLTLSVCNGVLPAFGMSQNIDINFDATDLSAGEVLSAEITLRTNPDCGTFVIPVTMTPDLSTQKSAFFNRLNMW